MADPAAVAARRIKQQRATAGVRLAAFYQENITKILNSLPRTGGQWYLSNPGDKNNLIAPINIAYIKMGIRILKFDNTSLDNPPPAPPTPPHMQLVPPGKIYGQGSVTGIIHTKQPDGSFIVETVSYPVYYQTGWGTWRFRRALSTLGNIEHAFLYATPAAIVAAPLIAPLILPAAAAPVAGGDVTAGAVDATVSATGTIAADSGELGIASFTDVPIDSTAFTLSNEAGLTALSSEGAISAGSIASGSGSLFSNIGSILESGIKDLKYVAGTTSAVKGAETALLGKPAPKPSPTTQTASSGSLLALLLGGGAALLLLL